MSDKEYKDIEDCFRCGGSSGTRELNHPTVPNEKIQLCRFCANDFQYGSNANLTMALMFNELLEAVQDMLISDDYTEILANKIMNAPINNGNIWGDTNNGNV